MLPGGRIYLLVQNLTLTGTLRKNNPNIPNMFTDGKGREVFSPLFWHCGDLTLMSYKYMPKINAKVVCSFS
jgi:hypothetical protein